MSRWLLEPLGLLHGEAAEVVLRTGLARPIVGGAFTAAKLITDGALIVTGSTDLPTEWIDLAERLAGPRHWAALPAGPLIMGVLNVTPDSFSDGQGSVDLRSMIAAVIAAGHSMVAAGADILDIGGESTRPHSVPVSPAMEQSRILPVIAALREAGRPISVDTRHAETMRAAVLAGATIVNDVSGLQHDPDALAVAAALNCPVVLMHMRGTPATMHAHADYADVAVDVTRELGTAVARAVAGGIRRENIAIDPGLGFAKTGRQNLEMLDRLPILHNLGCPIVVGASRKRFLGDYGQEAEPHRRGPASLAAHLHALSRGASVLRVHDVAETVQAVRVWQALQGWGKSASATSRATS